MRNFIGEPLHWQFAPDVKEHCIKNAYIWNSYLITYNLDSCSCWILKNCNLKDLKHSRGNGVAGGLGSPEPLHYSCLQMQAVR